MSTNNSKNNLQTTDTNMLCDMLANSEKLVPKDKRWHVEDELDENIPSISKPKIKGESLPDENSIFDKDDRDHGRSHRSEDRSYDKSNDRSNDRRSSDEDNEDIQCKKFDILMKLADLASKGVPISHKYTMQSDLKMMEREYKAHINIKTKANSVKFLGTLGIAAIQGLEMLNSTYDPFGLQLDGWHEQMANEIGNYYDVIGEIYEKWNKEGKPMSPEFRLIFMVGTSALMFHGSKVKIDKMATLNDTLNDNPELAETLRKKAHADHMNNIQAQERKNNEALKKSIEKDHNAATQRALDMQMLRQKEMEHLRESSMNAIKTSQLQQGLKLPTTSINVPVQNINQAQNLNNNQAQPSMQIPKAVENMMKQKQMLQQQMLQKKEEELIKQKLDTLEKEKKAQALAQMNVQRQYIEQLEKLKEEKEKEEKHKNEKRSETIKQKSVKSDISDNDSLSTDDSGVMIDSTIDKIKSSRQKTDSDDDNLTSHGKSIVSVTSKVSNGKVKKGISLF